MGQRHLNQTLTYWPPGDTDAYGKPISGSPVQKSCRWEDRLEQVQNKSGEQITSRTRIFLNDDVDIDGYVFLGTTNESDPTSVVGAAEIQAKGRQPDLRGLRSLTVVYL